MLVPFLNLARQYREIEAETLAAVSRVLNSNAYILSREVEAFEEEWAHFCKVRGAVGVGSGTDALTLALIASGVIREETDEVITSTLTSGYTALAIMNAGARPVFADINPETYTLSPQSIEAAITSRTRAIVPVHIYGQMADMVGINEIAERHDLVIIEDAAQAHGAHSNGKRAGARGRAGAFSFYPTKNLGAYGDGGAVISNDLNLLERVRVLRQGGHALALQGTVQGRNSRLDELQAAILRVKLKHLEKWNHRRRAIAGMYDAALGRTEIKRPFVIEPDAHVYHQYVVQHTKRDLLREHLAARGIETMIHYPQLLHKQPLFCRKPKARMPVAERAVDRILSLPIYPQLEQGEVQAIINAILEFEMLSNED